MSVQIPVEAKLEAADIDKVVQKLTEQMNRLGNAVAQANKIKFNPIDNATVDDIRRVTQQFDSLRKISGDLNKRLKATGQESKGFFDLDWKRLYADPSVRARVMRKQFEYVMAGTGASFSVPPGPAPVPSQRPAARPSPGAVWRGAGRNVMGAGLRAAGSAGSVADSALSAGMSGGAMAGIAGLVGGIAALGIGKLVGGVMGKVGDAQNDVIGYDTLKRTLGDVNVGFHMLRESLHASSDAFDVTYAQVLKLGNEFAHISGMSGEASKTLAEEVRVGGGFGRSFGIDPSQSNAFFAQMRLFEVTKSDADSRKLALYIGEAVAKSGSFAKTDQMLQAIASYTAQQTRLGLVTANVGGYSSLLAGLVGSHTPGLDPIGSASLLSKVNSAIAGGGGAGEAGQNFLYMAIGKRLGLNPIESDMLREQGAFGTGADAFGPGTKDNPSIWARFAAKYHLHTPATAARSHETSLQMALDHFHKVYAGHPYLMADAMSRELGINHNQAMALDVIGPAKLGGLQKALAANHVDLTKMSATGISALAQIYGGSLSTLNSQAAQLMPQLSDEDAAKLEKAQDSGNTEKFRSELIKLTAQYGQVQTEGSQTRASINKLDKDLIDKAGLMIGPLNDMRDIMIYALGDRGKGLTAADIHKKVVDAQRQAINDRADSRIGRAKSAYNEALSANGATPFYLQGVPIMPEPTKQGAANIAKARAHLLSETTIANKQRARDLANQVSPGLLHELSETDRVAGLTPGTSAAQMMQESSFDTHALSNKGAMGLAQVTPATLARLQKTLGKQLGHTLDPYNPEDAVQIQRYIMKENMRKFGNQDDALRAYNAGWNKSAWNNSETNNYLSSIDDYRRDFSTTGTPLPVAGAAAGGSKNPSVTVNVEGNFTLSHPSGQPAAAPVTTGAVKQVGWPMAFGSN